MRADIIRRIINTLIVITIATVIFLNAHVVFADGFTFVHISDSHIGASQTEDKLKAVLADIKSPDVAPDFIIHTGDVTEFGAIDELTTYNTIVQSAGIPVYSAIGNHETRWCNSGKKDFERLVGPRFRSFMYKGVLFVILDTSMFAEQYGHLSADQLTWLGQTLDSLPENQPVILALHHPVLGETRYVDNDLQLLQVIGEHNVSIILCGHGHRNAHWCVNGLHLFMTLATMGDAPGYRILKIEDGAASIFNRDVTNKSHEFECKIPLRREQQPRGQIRYPASGQQLNADFEVALTLSQPFKFELLVDTLQFRDSLSATGSYRQSIDFGRIVPGFHQIRLRRLAENCSWLESTPIQLTQSGTNLQLIYESAAGIQSAPLVNGEAIFIGDLNGDVTALNSTSGERLWRINVGDAVVTSPALSGGAVFITTTGGKCLAFDKNDGRIQWSRQAGEAIFSSPEVGNGSLYFGSGDSCLYALDTKTGEILWRFPTQGLIKCKPAYEAEKVVFGSWDRYFYAVSASDGALIWKVKITDNRYFPAATSNPLIKNGCVFVASHDHVVHCFDLATGANRWRHAKQDDQLPGYSSPAWYENCIILGSLSGHLFALDANSGLTKWAIQINREDPIFDSSPVIWNDKALIGSVGGIITALDLKQVRKSWSFKAGDGYIFASPAVDGNAAVFANMNGKVLVTRAR
ncbi:PQQ-binding-like beta-propeller repeat protein [candidate division KSB1 bacterium]|nr:PQQ-binding-like beta-propeller repeat protein [candidate division KSB1 bacterium]